jgi:hypothetical protein
MHFAARVIYHGFIIAASALHLAEKPHRAALVFGCSLDRNAVFDFCLPRGINQENFQECLQGHWCVDDSLNVKVSFMFHPGVGYNGDLQPPFHVGWNDALSTKDILDNYANGTSRHMLHQDPDLVVVDSSLWDLAVWREVAGRTASQGRVQQWCVHDLPNMLEKVAAAFPTSRIAFRTAPTVLENNRVFGAMYGIAREEIDSLYGCITSRTIGGKLYGKYDVIDYYGIVKGLVEENFPDLFKEDGYHPTGYPSALYMNEILKLLGAHPKEPVRPLDRLPGTQEERGTHGDTMP